MSATTISTEKVEVKTLKLEASDVACLTNGIPLPLPAEIPDTDPSVPHAPQRRPKLTEEQFKLAVKNALRYFPKELHAELAKEFADELRRYGHIYMFRLRPTSYPMHARPIWSYPARSTQAAAIMLMIQNNLDPRVAQYPHELVVYGGNGCAFSHWAGYHLTMKYLSEMTDDQTLVLSSGHPVGLFPSHPEAPRLVISNGIVIPNYASRDDYERMFATGVTMYGQMTAGSFCYIGPQGIVHGTTLTLLNAGRKYLSKEDMKGLVFITSGLGGMSGAQAKAAVICGCISVVAEVNEAAIKKRHAQGWVMEICDDLDKLVERVKLARERQEGLSIAYHGNIVSVWERFAQEPENIVHLGSDQTSLHNPYQGGYYPVQLSFEEANTVMVEDPARFKELVQESLRRHVAAVNTLVSRGMRFWDYGNSFLLEASRAGADILKKDGHFKYPSYVQDIMGDIFSLGFGPFRWVCTSGDPKDLDETDKISAEVIERLMAKAPPRTRAQYQDNYLWIVKAKENQMVVGSQARILYSDAEGRVAIAEAFNQAIKEGRVSAPIVLSRDHHDVSGTDSPYRETSNVTDGSEYTADMAIHTFVGDSFRGATWIALHHGGGTGWGEAINGGFGLVLDGSDKAAERARRMLWWDVNNGVARRSWSGNENAYDAIKRAMDMDPMLKVTLPEYADDSVLEGI